MHLTGRQLKQVHIALLSSFPSKTKLAQMVRFGLNYDLGAIAEGDNQSDRIFLLLNYAQANGCLPQLLEAALQENPNNIKLRSVAQQLGLTPPSAVNPPAAASPPPTASPSPVISPPKPTGWSRNRIIALGSTFTAISMVAAGVLLSNLPVSQEEQPIRGRRPTQSVGANLPDTTDPQASDKQVIDRWITLGVVEGKLTRIVPGVEVEFLVGPRLPPLIIASKTVPNTGDIVPLCPQGHSAAKTDSTSTQAHTVPPRTVLMQQGGAIEILDLRTAATPRANTRVQAKVQHFKSTDSALAGDFTSCSS